MSTSRHGVRHASLHGELTNLARPWVTAMVADPVVGALLDGTLDPAVMRRWLEQDQIYLRTYARVFARLASLAPDHHVQTLVDGAHYTLHTELPRLTELAGLFDADLTRSDVGVACAEYTGHLTASAERYESGAVAVLPCMMGFSAIGLVVEPPTEPRYRRWVEIYSAGDFQGFSARFADLVDDLDISWDEAAAIFESGMAMEVAMWNEAAAFVLLADQPTGATRAASADIVSHRLAVHVRQVG